MPRRLRRREFLRTWELVAKVPFFHDIGASLIAEVARLLRPRDYPAGAVIMRRGEPGDCMYFVADGEVEIQLPGTECLSRLRRVFRRSRAADRRARAMRPSSRRSHARCLVLDIVDFHELLARQPELARIIHEEAQQRRNEPTPAPAPLAEAALAIDESA